MSGLPDRVSLTGANRLATKFVAQVGNPIYEGLQDVFGFGRHYVSKNLAMDGVYDMKRLAHCRYTSEIRRQQ